jgi:hypothetical protein
MTDTKFLAMAFSIREKRANNSISASKVIDLLQLACRLLPSSLRIGFAHFLAIANNCVSQLGYCQDL